MPKPKYIFCTGGVVSSVGKGVTAAAIGRILKARGLKVAIQKLDPYLNVDPGTMSPYQHGEVFVTADGAETDLDLGHYERFVDENLNRTCNVTAGQVYSYVIDKERHGDYLGGTIQVVSHITNEIKRRIALVGKESNADVVIVEVGGTVGDIEGQPFLEAIRQLRNSMARNDSLCVHVTFLPYIGATHELKTKPTQHSVRDLRGIGIQAQVIIARTDFPVSKEVTDKIALFCDVDSEAVIPLLTTDLLYDVPLSLEDAGLGDYLVEQLGLDATKPALDDWRAMIKKMRAAKKELKIGVVGKYIELHDAYMSVKEALFHAAAAQDCRLEISWIYSGDLEKEKGWDKVAEVDGIVVPGGFGYRGVEGKVLAARFARERKVPYLGLCLGMQAMCIEFARNVMNLENANSSEFDQSDHAVIDLMLEQRGITEMGGTMRLGLYPCELAPGSMAANAYDNMPTVQERHRHRFEFNNLYRTSFEKNGMVFSGLSPDRQLVEISEIKDHPFMVGSQFHPEFLSRPNLPHPLFSAFVRSALEYRTQNPNRTFVNALSNGHEAQVSDEVGIEGNILMSIESFVQALPKVELDIHLEGSIRKETLLTIAEQNEIAENLKQFNQWVSLLDNPDYQRLDEIVQATSQWLLHADDFSRVVYELGVSLAKQNIRYAEVHVNPLLHLEHTGLTFEQFLTALNDGRSRCERAWGIQIGWILDIPRDQPRKADDVVRWVSSASAKKNGVVGMGLVGKETAQPAAQFERPFKTAQKKEVPRVVQAGTHLGAEGILEVLHQLEPDRILDGWGTADAPDVINLLTERHIPLNVSVARALCLGQVATYAKYPLRQLYDDGLMLTITSSMPSFFKTSLVDEYLGLVEHAGFELEEVEDIALNAVRASWLPDEDKAAMLQEFTSKYAELRTEHMPAAETPS